MCECFSFGSWTFCLFSELSWQVPHPLRYQFYTPILFYWIMNVPWQRYLRSGGKLPSELAFNNNTLIWWTAKQAGRGVGCKKNQKQTKNQSQRVTRFIVCTFQYSNLHLKNHMLSWFHCITNLKSQKVHCELKDLNQHWDIMPPQHQQ